MKRFNYLGSWLILSIVVVCGIESDKCRHRQQHETHNLVKHAEQYSIYLSVPRVPRETRFICNIRPFPPNSQHRQQGFLRRPARSTKELETLDSGMTSPKTSVLYKDYHDPVHVIGSLLGDRKATQPRSEAKASRGSTPRSIASRPRSHIISTNRI